MKILIQFFQKTELIELPISELLKSKIKIRKLFVGTSKNIEAPCFKFKNQLIWGATAMILNEFKFYLASQELINSIFESNYTFICLKKILLVII